MAKLVTLQATYRIVTPMFLGGAEPEKYAELREPSIKAALRFWWRTIKWAQIRTSLTDNKLALAELHKQEAALFGSAGGGQSQVLLSIKRPVKTSEVKKGAVFSKVVRPDRPGSRYLGYGVMEAFDSSRKGTNAGQLIRPCIDCGAEFTLEIRAHNAIGQEVIDALKLLGLLGGLGSRARKGYGSLTLVRLEGCGITYQVPIDARGYIAQVKCLLKHNLKLIDRSPFHQIPFSAFSNQSRIYLLLERNDPLTVLDDYGCQMQRYRSWGKDGKVNGGLSEENFEDDHAWYYGCHPNVNFHPRRVVFGLPHNYFGESRGAREVSPEKLDRRASPLWFHVHDYGQGQPLRYAGVATVLRSQFLPDGGQIKAGGKPVPVNVDHMVIDGFLDGCLGRRDAKTSVKYFPNAILVFP